MDELLETSISTAFSPSGLHSACPERTPSVTEEEVEGLNELRVIIEERESCLCSQQINFGSTEKR